MNRRAALLLLLALTGCPQRVTEVHPSPSQTNTGTQSADPYVGVTYLSQLDRDPLPGVRDMRNGNEVGSDGSYWLQELSDGRGEMIWLTRDAGHDAAGDPYWTILAVLRLPRLTAGQSVMFLGACLEAQTQQALDSRLVGILDRSRRIVATWRVDVAAASFTSTSLPESTYCSVHP